MRSFHLIVVIFTLVFSSAIAAVPASMNYQGRLTDAGGTPVADDIYSVVFTIYDDPSAGTSKWTETQSVTTSDGLFAVLLGSVNPITDSVFNGTTRYLSIAVAGDPELTPRTVMVSVPYAQRVSTVDGAAGGNITSKVSIGSGHILTGNSATITGGTNNLASGPTATVSGGTKNSATSTRSTVGGGGSNSASDKYATVGGGLSDTASGAYATISGGTTNLASGSRATVSGGGTNKASGSYSLVAGGLLNVASGHRSVIGGGVSDTAMAIYSGVASGYSNLAGDEATDTAAFIGGGYDNSATGIYSTVGGGQENSAIGKFSIVSGGSNNTASGVYAAIGGGRLNEASDSTSTVGGGTFNAAIEYSATVGGGQSNRAEGRISTIAGGVGNAAAGASSTISGGGGNITLDSWASIGGGAANLASGRFSTVPGGKWNVAAGEYSFAAGFIAEANHEGSFVLSDASPGVFSSTVDNEFSIKASGGTRIFSNSALTAGVTLAAGASSWTSVSDSTLKRNIREVDYDEVLEKVAELPISQWSYEAQDESIEHIGPMAQDFYRLFSLGEDDKHINTLDPDGIALAAIKALIVKNEKLEDELSELKKQVKELIGSK